MVSGPVTSQGCSTTDLGSYPIGTGVFYPAFGLILRPERSALLMAPSSIIVVVNAVLLRRVEGELGS